MASPGNRIPSKEPIPSVTLHLVLADRVLDRWTDAPSAAPFDLSDPAYVNAFYQGAFGPDLGYFPGGERFLSELSHLVRSADLTRALVSGARTPLERAFSLGWLTHVLADLTIHPLVGKAVGELVYGDRNVLAEGARHLIPHIQIETGLDAFYSHLFPALRNRKMSPVFDGDSVRFLADAYARVYGVILDPSLFLSSHLASVRMSVQGLMTIGTLSTTLVTQPVARSYSASRWVLRRALALVRMGLRRDSLLKAFLDPIPPTEWLVERVGRRVEELPDLFFRHVRDQLVGLPNCNLDTGEVQAEAPGAGEVLEALVRKGGAGFPAFGPPHHPTPKPRTVRTGAYG